MNRTKTVIAIALTTAFGLATTGGMAIAASAQPMAGTTQSSESQHPVSDTWITTKVKTELVTTHGIPSTDISVSTKNGVVTLIGVVPNKTDAKKAVAAAKSVKGVKTVDSSGLKVK